VYFPWLTKKPQPSLRIGSFAAEEMLRLIKRKLQSCAKKVKYLYLSCCQYHEKLASADSTYRKSSGITAQLMLFHPAGRFLPAWGHTRHLSASSPCAVPLTPEGSCPLPARFIISVVRYCCTM
jgi:hypothetical protein